MLRWIHWSFVNYGTAFEFQSVKSGSRKKSSRSNLKLEAGKKPQRHQIYFLVDKHSIFKFFKKWLPRPQARVVDKLLI